VDAERDKVAIQKLIKLRVESRQFSATSPVLTYPPEFSVFGGVTPLIFAEIFGIRKLDYLGYLVACLRDPINQSINQSINQKIFIVA